MQPSLIWTHDFAGVTPGPGTAFVEGRKSLTAALRLQFTNTVTSVISYTNFFGAEKLDPGTDRDSPTTACVRGCCHRVDGR